MLRGSAISNERTTKGYLVEVIDLKIHSTICRWYVNHRVATLEDLPYQACCYRTRMVFNRYPLRKKTVNGPMLLEEQTRGREAMVSSAMLRKFKTTVRDTRQARMTARVQSHEHKY